MKDEDFQKLVDGMSAETDKSYKMSAWQYGKKLSKKTKQKIGKKAKGRIVSEETKVKTSKTLTGRKATKETREKQSIALTGHVMTKETKAKISKAKGGVVSPEKLKHIAFFENLIKENPECTKLEMNIQFGKKFKMVAVRNATAYIAKILNHTWPKKKK